MYAVRSLVGFRLADPSHDWMTKRPYNTFWLVERENPTGRRIAVGTINHFGKRCYEAGNRALAFWPLCAAAIILSHPRVSCQNCTACIGRCATLRAGYAALLGSARPDCYTARCVQYSFEMLINIDLPAFLCAAKYVFFAFFFFFF
jgi:hypothetical protein